MDPSPTLLKLAEDIADGEVTSDWEVLASSLGPEERPLLKHLKTAFELAPIWASGTRPALRQPTDSDGRSLMPGSRWGELVVLAPLGSGRFGDVYRAWDPTLDRQVALKLLRAPGDADPARLLEEGRMMARVRHPNVATVHGAQRIEGVTGLWMEMIRGRTLAAELAAEGPFSAAALAQAARQLAAALQAVHEAGLVHRDVKPQNTFREPSGRVVLGDFGCGRPADDVAAGELAGTPAYIAPEVLSGAPATPQSDLYGLAATLFQLATGRPPVRAASLDALLVAHRLGRREALAEARPDVPPRLVRAIEHALEPDPSRRTPTAAALLEELEADAAGATGHNYPWAVPGRPRTVGILGTLGLMVVLLVSVLWPARGWQSPARTPARELYTQAETLLFSGRAGAAARLLQDAVARDGDLAMAHLLLAESAAQRGDPAVDVVAHTTRAVRTAGNATALERLLIAGRHEQALAALAADCAARVRHSMQAAASYRAALDLQPDKRHGTGVARGCCRTDGRQDPGGPRSRATRGRAALARAAPDARGRGDAARRRGSSCARARGADRIAGPSASRDERRSAGLGARVPGPRRMAARRCRRRLTRR